MVASAQFGALPGTGSTTETAEKAIVWGPEALRIDFNNLVIDSTAVDAGNTPTTELRSGLLLGKKTSDGNLYQWNHDASDGTEIIAGVLFRDISMLAADGTVEDKQGFVLLAGPLIAADLLVEGTALTSSANEYYARRQLALNGRFLLDDELLGLDVSLGPALRTLRVTGNTTLVAADRGTLYLVDGAANMTLPTIKLGLVYEFFNCADSNMTITSAAGNDMITFNDVAASSVAFTTAGEKAGAHVRVEAVDLNGTLKWIVKVSAEETQTMTVT